MISFFLQRTLLKCCLYVILFSASAAFAQQTSGKWITYTDTVGAFSVKVPVEPKKMVSSVPSQREGIDSIQVYTLIAVDEDNEKNYIFQHYDYPKGMYLSDRKLTINSMIDKFRQGDKGEIVMEPKPIKRQDYYGYQMAIVSQGYYMELQFFLRGNRIYVLIVQNTASDEQPEPDDFFDSFRFEPYHTPSTVSFTLGTAKLRLPGEAKLTVDTHDPNSAVAANQAYYATNPNSGGVYGVETGTFNKYVKYDKIDTLYYLLMKQLSAENDSVRKIENHLIGQIRGSVYTAKDTLAGTEVKALVWVDGDKFYSLYARVAAAELQSDAFKNFFDQVSYVPSKSKFNLGVSKAELILTDLQKTDTTLKKAAFAALDYYKFETGELPGLYKTLKLNFADDTVATGARTNLLTILRNVNDRTTVPFLKELYQTKLPNLIKVGVLTTVPVVDSTQYDWYLSSLLESQPLKLKNYWPLFDPLADSLSYFAKNFERILPFFDNQDYRPILLQLTNDILEEKDSVQNLSLIAKHKDKIMGKAMADIDRYLAEKSQSPSAVYPYLKLLPVLKLPALTDQFTNKVFKLDSMTYLHTLAMVARIKMGLSLNQQQRDNMLDSLSSRYELIAAYHEMNRLAEVPTKYTKHDEFAKLLVYRYLEGEDSFATAINLLGKVQDKNGTYYAFETVFEEEGGQKKYLALVGTFNDQKQMLALDSYETLMEWEEVKADWMAQAKAIIAKLNEAK
jgi:hypothetical protein